MIKRKRRKKAQEKRNGKCDDGIIKEIQRLLCVCVCERRTLAGLTLNADLMDLLLEQYCAFSRYQVSASIQYMCCLQ